MTSPNSIVCHTCAAPIPAKDIELSLMIAKCTSCDAVFSFADTVGHTEQEVVGRILGDDSAPAERVMPTDHKVKVKADTDNQLTLSMGWFSAQTLFMAMFAVFWNGFLLVWYAIGITGFLAGESGMIIMLLFPVLHVAAGFYVGYTAICGFVNSTTISVDRTGIEVVHGPLPWPGNVSLQAQDVDQLYVVPRVITGKNSTRTVYDLKAVDRGGSEITVLRTLEDDRAALFMERRIEQWLGIEDRRIAGQHG